MRPISASTWCGRGKIRSRLPCSPANLPKPAACSPASATSWPIGTASCCGRSGSLSSPRPTLGLRSYFPYVVVSPAYFAGAMQLGGLVQTAGAFGTVETALSFFINVYRDLAEWRAVIARLDGFDRSIGIARATTATAPTTSTTPPQDGAAPGTENRAHDRGVVGSAAERRTACRHRGSLHRGGRARPRHRTIRLRKIDLAACHRRPLAVRQGLDHGAAWRQADDAAAAALFPGWQPRGSGVLSIGARRLRDGAPHRGSRRGWAARAGSAACGRSALEPDAVARRAAAPWHRPRHPS